MAHIRKHQRLNPDGKSTTRYHATVTRKGHRRTYKTFATRSAAETWARHVESDMQKGSYRSTDRAERMTLGDAFDRYLAEILPTKKSQKSIQSQVNTIRPHLGSTPLLALDGEVIASYRDTRLRMKARRWSGIDRGQLIAVRRSVSTETVRKELLLIRRVINTARREWGVHLPAGNPLDFVALPKPSRPRTRRFEGDEEARLFSSLGDNGRKESPASRHLRAAITLAIETGIRRGELTKLNWADIDLGSGLARLRDTKNGEDRVIPLSTRAVEALQTIHGEVGKVFPFSLNALSMSWRRILKRAQIKGLRFHDLRHEAISRMFERGLNPMEVAFISGHKTLQMVKNYTHLRATELAKKLG